MGFRRAGSTAVVRRFALVAAATGAFALLAPSGSPPPGPESAQAATLPAGFEETVAFSGLTNPTVIRFASDGRVFVAEKSGIIKVYSNLSDSSPTVFANLGTNVHNYWDRGLLGMALDPNFPATPYVYVLYAYDHQLGSGSAPPRWGDACPSPPGPTTDGCVVSGRLSRLQAAGDLMTGSEQVLVEDWCQQYPSHSLGTVEFGPDGALYASAGEGASFTFFDYGQEGIPPNPCGDPPTGVGGTQTPPSAEGGALRSQDLRTSGDPATLDGSVIRVDPATGAGLPSNPFAGSGDANVRRIIAYGQRNPFRFTFRPGTSELWIGDVGWGDWEEINRIPNPSDATVENFGWPCYEGTLRSNGPVTICEDLYDSPGAETEPYFAYRHQNEVVPGETCAEGSSSISGLAFNSGFPSSFPSQYAGALFFADYSRDCIWAMKTGGGSLPSPASLETFVAAAENPVNLQFGPGGDLYYADFDGGTIRRVRWTGGGAPTVTSTTPPNGASGVVRGVSPTATFSEPMTAATITTTTLTLVKQGTGTPVAASVVYDAATRTATLDPTALLDASSIYTATVKGGASGVKDAGGTPLAADFNWSFTTGTDTSGATYLSDLNWTSAVNYGPVIRDLSHRSTPLTLNGTVYPKGLGAHAVSDVRYTISNCSRFKASVGVDDYVASDGSVVFEVYAGATKVYDSGLMTGSTATKLVDVSIAGATQLRLVVTNGNGNIDSDHADWALARIECGGGADTTPPTITATSPASGASGVAIAVSPTVAFSEAMNPATITASTFTLVQQGQTTPLPATVSYASQVATLDPTSNLLANTTYTATVKGGASGAKDVAGNALASDVSWSFTTAGGGADTTPPTITARTPAPGATGVARDVSPSATFSEAMNPATLTTTTFTLIKQGSATPVAAAVSYASGTATLDPSAQLDASSTYTATVKGGASGAKDVAGNALAADSSWSFTTGTDTPPPTGSTYLSDLTWSSAVDYGTPQLDRSHSGNPLTLNGTVYPKGIGAHAVSDIRYTISGCSRFKASVGVDDEEGSDGSVTFEVYAGASKVYDSGLMTGSTATELVDVSIAGATELRLVVTNGGDNINSDHADWALARIECS